MVTKKRGKKCCVFAVTTSVIASLQSNYFSYAYTINFTEKLSVRLLGFFLNCRFL